MIRKALAISPWLVILCLAPLFLVPASLWLKVSAVRVSDTTVGEQPPAMYVDRVIYRKFSADWIVTVRRRGPSGGFSVFCEVHGKSNYLPGADLPDRLTLDWWLNSRTCRMTAGEYLVHTTWRLNLLGPLSREISVTSNVFTVRAAR